MCGICGFTGKGDQSVIKRMNDILTHRGPDDSGYWNNSEISLGMRRLAIIDIESGHQPVFSENKDLIVIFNGEIYNHIELRAELITAGHNFYTDHCDTEVIVHLYQEYGPEYLHKLNGMFAIALWDKQKMELHLARDRAGIKPLFYSYQSGQLIFASEIKSILLHPSVSVEPDYNALNNYFSLKNTPSPHTVYSGIKQLLPGERLVFKDHNIKFFKWWSIDFSNPSEIDEVEAATQIREILEDSVRMNMLSDVPYGAYLSGGIDSSSVVALMTKISGTPVTTFSLTYEKDYMNKSSDTRYSRLISNMYETDHHEMVMTQNDLVKNISCVLEAFDEPYSGVTSTFFLTRLISKHVKVALSGDGADELFASYLSHRIANPLFYFDTFKNRLNSLSDSERNKLVPFENELEKLMELNKLGSEPLQRIGLYLMDDPQKQKMFTRKMKNYTKDNLTTSLISKLYDRSSTNDPLNRALFVDFETLLPDQVLAFVDRLSMVHSVEVRPPFLDHRLIELAASLPGNMKIKNGREKHILKEAIKDLLPNEILNRKKEGFILPINDWIMEGLGDFIKESLHESRLNIHGLLNPVFVKNMLDEQLSGKANNAAKLWNITMFQVWWERTFA